MRSLPLVLLAAACSWSPPQLPVRVVGDGEQGVVRGHELVRAARAPRSARRVLDDDGWRALREDCGGALGGRAAPVVDWDDECLVVVPLERAAVPVGVVVSSEEGVDVVTLDVAAAAPGGAQQDAPRAAQPSCLSVLRIGRRPHQLAVVVRDEQRGREQTVGVFDPY